MMSVSSYPPFNQLKRLNDLLKFAEEPATRSIENPVKFPSTSTVSKSFSKQTGKRKNVVLPKPVTKRVKVESEANDKEVIKHKISHLIRIIADQSKDPKEKMGGNWQCWSKEEEIFLVGAVLDRFFARGSLSSTKQENSDSTKKNCWDTIKESYDKCFKKYCALVGKPTPPSRTENALSRHYKVMKERSLSKTHRNAVDFRALYEEWETNFNQKYQLIVDPVFDTPSTKKKELLKDNKLTPLPSKGRWNYSDEVVLIGIVVETFFNRGSLSSSHKERKKKEKDLWQNLHELYREIKMKYYEINNFGSTPTERTAQALARHFKVLKVKLIESKGKINLKTFYKEWVKDYRQIYLNIVVKKEAEQTPMQTYTSIPQQNIYLGQNVSGGNKISEEAKLLANLRSMRNVSMLSKPSLTPTSYPLQPPLAMNPALNGLTNFNTHPFGLTTSRQLQRPDFGFSLSTPGFDVSKVHESYNNFPTRTSTPSPTGSTQFNSFPNVMNPTAGPLVTTAGNATTYWLPLTLYNTNKKM